MLNPKSLKLFHLITEKGTLAAAAEALYTSAPAASRMISLMESELGFELFSREGRNLMLTAKGARFLRESHPILESYEGIEKLAADISADVEPQLRILSSAPISLAWVAPAVKLLKSRHPQITIRNDIVDRVELQSSVGSGFHDIAIASFPISSSVFSLESRMLCKFQFEVVFHQDNPLASKPVIAAKDLEDQPIISLNKKQIGRSRVDEYFQANGIELRPTIETSSSVMSLAFCAQNLGVTIVPGVFVHCLKDQCLASRPLIPERWITFGTLMPKSKPVSPLQKEFLRDLRSIAEAWPRTQFDNIE